MSPIKLREVVALIKKMKPAEAVDTLPFIRKGQAKPLAKVIGSAIANARQLGKNPEDLVFKEIQIGEGPRLKRFRAGARGRAKPYVRKMSHIRVVLTTKSDSQNVNSSKLKAQMSKPKPKTIKLKKDK